MKDLSAIDLISILLSVSAVAFSVVTYIKNIRHDRKKDTLDAYNRLQAEVFDKLNTYTPLQIREIAMDNKSADYKTVSGYLARIEHFCVGLNQGIYDKKTFYALAHGYFDKYQLRKRIEPMLKSKNSNKNTSELFYNDTLSVLKWMDKKAGKT